MALLAAAMAAPVVLYAQVTYPIDLPAQSLADSLRDLGKQARVSVIFDPATVKGHNAAQLKGSYTLDQVFAKLLNGTGFSAQFTDAATVVIKSSAPPPKSTPKNTQRRDEKPVLLGEAQSTAARLEAVTVLGSLLPRAQIEGPSPVTLITADSMKANGFSNVADALQNLTLNTSANLNTSINTGDMWGAKQFSLFGLPANFTKFLIDGRPMPNYSQLAQNEHSDTLITNLTGIPIDVIDHVEIMPGGGSSLYGSDAMAGVVNIVLKKNVNFGTLDVSYGGYPSGGGESRRISFNDSFHWGDLSLTLGGQIDDEQPIWAFQRRITAQNFAGNPSSPQRPDRVAAVQSFFTGSYYFADPAQCAQLKGLFRGSVQLEQTPTGNFCGSVSDRGSTTLTNKEQGASVNAHATYTVNDRLQLYADAFDSYQKQSHSSPAYLSAAYYDPNLNDLISLARNIAPEEIGNRLSDSLLQKNYENTAAITVGGKGDLGRGWNLDVGLTRSLERINDRETGLLTSGLPDRILGPQLGTFLGFPIQAPSDYAALFEPLTPAQMQAYLGSASIASTSRSDLARGQLSRTSLFSLPGGDAGLALVAESGYESWKYLPSPKLYTQTATGVTSEIAGFAWQPSNGHRSRYAGAAELNLPLFKMLTVDLSARYDRYNAEGTAFDHATWGAGLEFRPVDTLLLRGKIGTSFKAPDLIDEFEGDRTYVGQYGVDFLTCAKLGFSGAAFGDCPVQYQGALIIWKQLSNPNLQPITSRSWSYGFVYSPFAHFSVNIDYQHIDIRGEVLTEDPGYLLQNEFYCSNGTFPASSPSCRAAANQIIRAPAAPGSSLPGPLLEVDASKINLAHELNNSITAGLQYRLDIGGYGNVAWNAAYTVVLTHNQQTFPGDPTLDFLRMPNLVGTEFKNKFNAGVTWTGGSWSATLYGTRYGKTPNFAAGIGGYSAPGAGNVAPWMIYNASVSYSPMKPLRLSLRINNLMNSMPPFDGTRWGRFNQPFSPASYNPYGRQILLEAQYQFGHSASN